MNPNLHNQQNFDYFLLLNLKSQSHNRIPDHLLPNYFRIAVINYIWICIGNIISNSINWTISFSMPSNSSFVKPSSME